MPGRPLTLPQVADKLGVHYMTAYRYVRTGRLPARRVGGAWQVDSGDLAHVQRSRHGPRSPRATGRAPSPTRLEARLVAGDEAGAWDVLEASLASGMEPGEVLLDLVGPALRSIGTLWEHGKLSVADEHRASNLAARLISRLGARFARRGQKRGTVIVAAAPGERHGLPVAIAANLLRWRGFDVVELGADTPADSLAAGGSRRARPRGSWDRMHRGELFPGGATGDRRRAPVRTAGARPPRWGRNRRCRSRPPPGRRHVHR